jgi:hypothetical protein
MLYREIIAVCSQIHTKHTNTLCGQNVEVLNVKLAVHIVTTGFEMVIYMCSDLQKFQNCWICFFGLRENRTCGRLPIFIDLQSWCLSVSNMPFVIAFGAAVRKIAVRAMCLNNLNPTVFSNDCNDVTLLDM